MTIALPPDMRARVLAQIKATPSPDASATRRGNVAAIVLGVATATTMIAALGLSLGGRPLAFVAVSAAGWAAIAFAASIIAVGHGAGGRQRSMLGSARVVLVAGALAAAPAIFGWVMGVTVGWPEVREPAGTWHTHIACLVATMLLSIGPIVALSYLRRVSDPVHPRATGAAIGAAAGAWGGVLIDMHCPLVAPLHVAVAHVLPVVLYAAIGALVGGRMFGVRATHER